MAANSPKQPRRGPGKPFVKGQSGNPSGRPPVPVDLHNACKAHTTMAIERLVHWANSSNPTASVAAIRELLSRAYGNPTQPLSADGPSALVVQVIRFGECDGK